MYTIQFGLREPDDSQAAAGPALPKLTPPSPEDFLQHYAQLSREYDSVLVLPISARLAPVMQNALEACRQFSNHAQVAVVDSKSTAIGLGMLVQEAAKAILQGATLAEIERRIRIAIPRIYMLICIPELSYLARTGYIDFAQALVGEILGILPVFSVEDGRLVPLEKVRTPRHLFEAFQDFMGEFEAPAHIALVRGSGQNTLRTRPLRQFIQENFPGTPYSEHPIQTHLAALFGPECTGLVVKEASDRREEHENRLRD